MTMPMRSRHPGQSRPERRTMRHLAALAGPLLTGWMLVTPPTPLGTTLPPASEWLRVSTHQTSEDCERARTALRQAAAHTVTADPNATALAIDAARGRLRATCVQTPATPPAGGSEAEAPAAKP